MQNLNTLREALCKIRMYLYQHEDIGDMAVGYIHNSDIWLKLFTPECKPTLWGEVNKIIHEEWEKNKSKLENYKIIGNNQVLFFKFDSNDSEPTYALYLGTYNKDIQKAVAYLAISSIWTDIELEDYVSVDIAYAHFSCYQENIKEENYVNTCK